MGTSRPRRPSFGTLLQRVKTNSCFAWMVPGFCHDDRFLQIRCCESRENGSDGQLTCNFLSVIKIARNYDVFIMDHRSGEQLAAWRDNEGFYCGLIFLANQQGL